MKLKISLAGLLLALAVATCHAQEWKGLGFGVKAGLNIANLNSVESDSRYGVHAGIFADWYFTRNFGLELGVYYSQQGNKARTQYGTITQKLDYLSVPLTFNYRIYNKARVFVGPQFAGLLNGGSSLFPVRDMDITAIAGLGYTFGFGLDLSTSYTIGVRDLHRSGYTGSGQGGYTSVWRVSVGYRFLR